MPRKWFVRKLLDCQHVSRKTNIAVANSAGASTPDTARVASANGRGLFLPELWPLVAFHTAKPLPYSAPERKDRRSLVVTDTEEEQTPREGVMTTINPHFSTVQQVAPGFFGSNGESGVQQSRSSFDSNRDEAQARLSAMGINPPNKVSLILQNLGIFGGMGAALGFGASFFTLPVVGQVAAPIAAAVGGAIGLVLGGIKSFFDIRGKQKDYDEKVDQLLRHFAQRGPRQVGQSSRPPQVDQTTGDDTPPPPKSVDQVPTKGNDSSPVQQHGKSTHANNGHHAHKPHGHNKGDAPESEPKPPVSTPPVVTTPPSSDSSPSTPAPTTVPPSDSTPPSDTPPTVTAPPAGAPPA